MKPRQLVISNGMIKLLKKGNHGVISQLYSLDVQKYKPYVSLDLQRVFDKHSKVFEDIPKGLPPTQDHDHVIHLIMEVFLLTSNLMDTHMARRAKLSI